jgi:ATP-binding cassette subfamily B protein
MKEKNVQPLEWRYNRKRPFFTFFLLFDGEKSRLVISVLLYVIKHSPVMIMPILTADIINIITLKNKPLAALWLDIIILSVIVTQNIISHTAYAYFFNAARRNMSNRLRGALIRRLQQLSMHFHSTFQSGRLQSKLLRDVESIELFSRNMMNSVVPGTISIVVALSVTLYRKPLMALFFMSTIPISVFLVWLFRKPLSSSNRQLRHVVEILAAHLSEMIEMIPVTRAHGVENVELDKAKVHLAEVKRKGFRLDMINDLFGSSAWVVFQMSSVACLGMCGYLSYNGRIPVGDVVMYQSFYMMILGSVTMFINMYPELTKGAEAIYSIGDVLECPDIEHNEGKKTVTEVNGLITFDRVSFIYPDTRVTAINDFSCEIRQGECVALVGESGGGKSTLMNLIIGFYRPSQGRIMLDGVDMQTLDFRTFRQFLAVVPQNTILFSGSIRDNITYGLSNVSDKHLTDVMEMANVSQFITKLPNGVDTLIGEHGSRLSGGQRQRIAIARAIIRDPRIIILDEATSSLDVASEKLVQEAVERLIFNRTTLIVAHRLSTIRNADRIIVLKKGSCTESGTQEELLEKKGEFYQLKMLQV